MEFHLKLPRNTKEFVLFLAIVSIISVNIVAPLITFFEVGFHIDVWAQTLSRMPLIWMSVIALVLLTHKPADWLASRFVKQGDSFSATMIVNTLCNVLLMSVFMTVLGAWIGTGEINMEPISMFFYKWPRNFAIAFAVEALIAQPVARIVMLKLHQMQDKRGNFDEAQAAESLR